jgi:hypothetical protein
MGVPTGLREPHDVRGHPPNAVKVSLIREVSQAWPSSGLVARKTGLYRHPEVEEIEALGPEVSQEGVGLLGGYDEAHLHGQIPRQFDEPILVETPVATKTCQGTKGRPAVDTLALRFLQEPLIGESVMVTPVLSDVKLEETALHARLRWVGTMGRFFPVNPAKSSSSCPFCSQPLEALPSNDPTHVDVFVEIAVAG